MEYITTASFSVLVNGVPGEPFKLERGIRQGDLLSPYIVVICVECLGRYIHYVKCSKIWNCHQTGQWLGFLRLFWKSIVMFLVN